MRQGITGFLVIALIGLTFSADVFSQEKPEKATTKEKISAASSLYVISAKAGAVNYVSGKVAVNKADSKNGFLVKGDSVNIGDKVKTGAAGKAEILLNPGSFVRLAENAEFEFKNTDLDNLQLNLIGGSAIFEVFADDKFNVAVNTPKSKFYLVKTGVYRIDVAGDGLGKLSVWKGKARIGNNSKTATVVKGGQTTVSINGQSSIEKFDRDEKGDLELWSKDRAKELAKVNARLQSRAMNRSLISAFGQNRWDRFSGAGFWVFDPLSRSHCFLPLGYGWSSPYGFGFGRSIWNYNVPGVTYNAPNQNNQGNPNWGNAGNPPPGGNPSSNNGGGRPQPPMMGSPPSDSISRPIVDRPMNRKMNEDMGRPMQIPEKRID